MSAHPEWVPLLVEACDMLGDLVPDPEFEEPDEGLEAWLARADKLLKAITGQSSAALVRDHLARKMRQVQ